MISTRSLFRLSAVLLVTAALAVATFAQGTNAALSGTVTDSNQAAVPGATVTAQNVNTGVTTTTTTNGAGV